MYKDSDGYILIDMSDADISKSSQSINGFYDRIVDSINTNKLVLVINFGDYSPMPAIAHKKLNYYVITTSLYIITINSNDIVIIQEAGETTVDVSIIPALQSGVKIADFSIGEVEGSLYAPEQENIINDNVTADNTTWSSDKIDSELDTKVDAASLAAVATSGSYNDLTNTPILADVAISGSYTDLTNKPTIPADLDDLSDVTLTSPTNGQTLVYDATAEQFVNATPPSGVTTLAGLSDVSITTPASGNVLSYDGSEWVDVDITADDITYDNTASGLSADDLQEAVDEVSGKVDDLAVITQSYTVATYGGTIKFTRQGNIVTLQAYGIGVSQAISAVGVITLLSNIDERFLPANDVYIAGFRTSGYSTDHFQGYRLRDTSQRTLISYVYTSKPIDNGCFTIAYSV